MDCAYIDETTHAARDEEWRQVGAMIAGMIDRADSFCDP